MIDTWFLSWFPFKILLGNSIILNLAESVGSVKRICSLMEFPFQKLPCSWNQGLDRSNMFLEPGDPSPPLPVNHCILRDTHFPGEVLYQKPFIHPEFSDIITQNLSFWNTFDKNVLHSID